MNKKYQIICTTGAFDPFHYGHLNIIKKSKEIADLLIVGVSTDALVEKEKNRKIFMPLEHRMSIISELKSVDKVIPQIDKNKQKIVDQFHIDAIVVGSDWKGKYPKVSCDVIYLDYTDYITSTKIRNKLKT